MRLIGNFAVARDDALKQKIELFKTAGFEGADYILTEMFQDNCDYNTDNYKAVAEGVRKVFDEMNFPITQSHAPYRFTAAQIKDPNVFEEVVFKRVARSIEIAGGIFGADTHIVHPITQLTYRGNEELLFEMNMNYYRRLIPYAKEYNIKICVENMFSHDARHKCFAHSTCSHKEEFVRYVDELDSEYVVACLDVGHVCVPVQEDEPWDVIRALGHDRLQALHIHDNDYSGDQHLLPYLGAINWEEVAKALGEIDYQGEFTYEVPPRIISGKDEGFAPIGAKFMADVGHHIISMIEANRPKK